MKFTGPVVSVVAVVVVALAVLLFPRVNTVPVASVDVARSAAAANSRLGFAPSVPRGLPQGWTPREATVQRGTDGRPTWHLTYATPSGAVAGVQQTAGATPAWEARQVTDGPEQGTRYIDGVGWVVRSRLDRGVISLVRRPGPASSLTTVVTGTGTQAELDALATAL